MYSSVNENRLLRSDIVDLLQDHVSIQFDIDETRIKSAALIAQDLDIEKIIGGEVMNLFTGVYSKDDLDEEYQEIYTNIISAWCFLTYSRLLLMFHGNYSDSGFEVDSQATDRNLAKSVSKEHKSVGEFYLSKAVDLLEITDSEKVSKKDELTPRVRVFGGREVRASN